MDVLFVNAPIHWPQRIKRPIFPLGIMAHPLQACYRIFVNLEERIEINPEVRGGKPCVRGTRITVYDILEYLAGGMTEDGILRDFPSLTREDLRAVLAFAAARERRLASAAA